MAISAASQMDTCRTSSARWQQVAVGFWGSGLIVAGGRQGCLGWRGGEVLDWFAYGLFALLYVAVCHAGFVSAGLFRSPRGPKAAVIAGTVGAVAAAGLASARQYFPSL
jgi:hypothetical protein